jgi:quercetin dioxygenase-like cupin family protein
VKRLLLVLAACGHPSAPPAAAPSGPPPADPKPAAAPVDAAVSDDEKLAAIQKAMNDLSGASQQCWAAAATERFAIEGELTAQIDIAQGQSHATIVRDTARNKLLASCLVDLLQGWQFAPPLYGQSIQLPFKFRAPDGQSVIDRRLVATHVQGPSSVAVYLDENNTGNGDASMFGVKLTAATGPRTTDRAELWYFLAPGTVDGKPVAAGDMAYVPAKAARDIGPTEAVVFAVPGGHEGSARAGALPTPSAAKGGGAKLFPAAGAKTYGPATIFVEPSRAKGAPLSASLLTLPKGASVPEHVHAKETEMLYVLAGAGTITIAGTQVPVTPTSVIQIPPNTKHAFTATEDFRAVQLYTPAGPEQRFKKP